MEPEPVGRVLTEARIENLKDLWDVRRGILNADQARSLTVTDGARGHGCALAFDAEVADPASWT